MIKLPSRPGGDSSLAGDAQRLEPRNRDFGSSGPAECLAIAFVSDFAIVLRSWEAARAPRKNFSTPPHIQRETTMASTKMRKISSAELVNIRGGGHHDPQGKGPTGPIGYKGQGRPPLRRLWCLGLGLDTNICLNIAGDPGPLG